MLGLAGIAIVLFLAMVIVFIPSEILVAFAGYSAATGKLSIFSVLAAAIIGVYLGMLAVYGAARYAGLDKVNHFIERYGKYIRLRKKDIEKAERWFQRYSAKVSLFGQLIPALRFGVALFAGMQKLPFWTYVTYTFIGTVIWVGAFAMLGYHFTEGYKSVVEYYDFILKAAGVVVLLVLGYIILKRRRHA